MMNASQPHYAFTDYEASFDSKAAVAWAAEHPDLPVFAVALYLAFIFCAHCPRRTRQDALMRPPASTAHDVGAGRPAGDDLRPAARGGLGEARERR